MHKSLRFRRFVMGLALGSLLLGMVFGAVLVKPTLARAADVNPATNPNVSGPIDICQNLYADANVQACLAGSPSNNPWEQQAFLLQSISSVLSTGQLFTHSIVPYLGSDPKSGGTNGGISTINVHIHLPGSDGFKARFNTLSRFQKVEGNPWLEWSDGSGNVSGSEQLPPNTGGKNSVRFVLTGFNVRTGDPGVVQDVTQNTSGVVYIFRNEYNPRLAVMLWSRNGNDTSGIPGAPDGGNDDNRLVYSSTCSGVTDPTAEAANVDPNINGDDRSKYFPDTADALKTAKKQYKYQSLPGDNCSADTGFLGQAMQWITEGLDTLIGTIVGWVSGIVNVGSLPSNPGLTSAWKTLRDFVDLIFILILVVISFSNILRIDTEKYGVRALLPRLIFAVIAVNFSFLLIQIMVNVAYILSSPFLHAATQLITNPPADGSVIDPSGGFGDFVVAVLVLIGVIIGLLVLLLFFVVRILMIWLLAATSPFVFLFMILPLTRSLASKWFQNAVKWIFMAPVAFVLLFIAAEVISGGGSSSSQSSDVSDPNFFLKIGFFIGACIAAVIIPLKLGGEVMGRAVSGAQRGGRFGKSAAGKLPGARTLAAYNEQRKANQEQGSKLRAAAIQGGVSDRLSRFPGGRAAASFLAGGRAGMIGSQQAAIEGKYAKDIEDMNLNPSAQKMIAAGDTGGLRNAGLHRAANLSNTGAGRRAAGRLLGQKGLLTASALDAMPARQRREQITAGNQAYMRSVDPVLAARNSSDQITPKAIEGIGAQVSASEPGHTKEMYWGEMEKSLHSADPREREAGKKAFSSISSVNAKDNIDQGNRRNLISDDSDRAAYVRGIQAHGNNAAKDALTKQLDENVNTHNVGNGGVGG